MIIEVVRPRNAQAPTGRGLRTRPAIVDKKIDSNCHACGETSGGFGTKNRTISPTATERNKGTNFAPCGSCSVAETSATDEIGGIGLWVLVGFGRGLKRNGLGVTKDGNWPWRGCDRRREQRGTAEMGGGDLEREKGREGNCKEMREVEEEEKDGIVEV